MKDKNKKIKYFSLFFGIVLVSMINLATFGAEKKYTDIEICKMNKELFEMLKMINKGKCDLKDYGLYCEIEVKLD